MELIGGCSEPGAHNLLVLEVELDQMSSNNTLVAVDELLYQLELGTELQTWWLWMSC